MGEFRRDKLPDPVDYFESEGLMLKGRAEWRTTECKFHGGSDSMRINTRSGGWRCMNCGAKGGDVLSHHMAEYGLDFISAAIALGAWQGAHGKQAAFLYSSRVSGGAGGKIKGVYPTPFQRLPRHKQSRRRYST